jgi:hypothetical protein
MLQVLAITVMVFPSNEIVKAVGGGGYLAALVAYFLFAAWIVASLFGFHDPREYASPVRLALAGLWLSALVTYAFVNRGMLTADQQSAESRWLMQLALISGIVLVASEELQSFNEVKRVVTALIWGGGFCGFVAALQFKLNINLLAYIPRPPGLSVAAAGAGYDAITSRGAVSRVTGTAIHPIELGVTMSMLLPIAIWMGMYGDDRKAWRRWLPALFIGIAIPASVSRSAILGMLLSVGTLTILLPPLKRLNILSFIPIAVAGVFVTAHGLVGTFVAFFSGTSNDGGSINNRTNNYPMVERLVTEAPWLGRGGGTYLADNAIHILDNEYLTMAIELGLVGVATLLFFFVWPAVAAFVARARTADPGFRALCAALGGAELAAGFGSATFDSLSFPMFVIVQALVAGLIGAVWFLSSRDSHLGGPSQELRASNLGQAQASQSRDFPEGSER